MEMRGRRFISETASHFKMKTPLSLLFVLSFLFVGLPVNVTYAESPIKKTKGGLYTDISDYGIYYEATQLLHLDRLYRKLFNKKVHAEDINIYDEVPDSSFFQNRHAAKPLSLEALEQGYAENSGPSPEGAITIIKGKSEGLHPGFFVKDSRGDKYLLKFDSHMNMELNTSAEVIASRVYHAAGYNVPQYTVFVFESDRLVPDAAAMMTDSTGFKKKLTPEMLEQFLIQLPRDSEGRLRASASKILAGENSGPFSYHGRRKDDPEDLIAHEKRRSLRALLVFASWLNNNDVRYSNTLDMWVTENGRSYLKHYLIDFNSALGGAAGGAKPPTFTHEYFPDYGEASKNLLAFGFRESDWHKRWKLAGKKRNDSEAQGYLDNHYFSPEKFKVQFPNYAFKDLTRADGFWAAKIIKSFSDEEVRAMVRAGRYTKTEDTDFLVKILVERRDMIARYWFTQASPLDRFRLEGNKLVFTDLEVDYGFAKSEGSVYSIQDRAVESPAAQFELPEEWLQSSKPEVFLIRVQRPGEKKVRPFVLVEITGGKITRVLHQD